MQIKAFSHPWLGCTGDGIPVGTEPRCAALRQLGPPNPSGAKSCAIALDRDGNIVLARLGRPPRATLATALRKIGA
jgi:hypothetical protein